VLRPRKVKGDVDDSTVKIRPVDPARIPIDWSETEGFEVEMDRVQAENRLIPDLRTKLGPFLRTWLDEVAKPSLRASTYQGYDGILKLHLIPGLGRMPLAKLTPADVQTFRDRKLESGLPPPLVDPPRVHRREITPLTPEQARLPIETSTHDRYRGLWITALGTGLRQGELLALRWEDLDLTAGCLWVRHTLANVAGTLTLLEPKTDRSRRLVVLPEAVRVALRAHRTRQQGPARAQHHRADLEHLRACPRAAPAGDGAWDGRGAGWVTAQDPTERGGVARRSRSR
jgi:integrase